MSEQRRTLKLMLFGMVTIVLVVLIAILIKPTENSENSTAVAQNSRTDELIPSSSKQPKPQTSLDSAESDAQPNQTDRSSSKTNREPLGSQYNGFNNVLATESKLIVRANGDSGTLGLDINRSASVLSDDESFYNALEDFSADEQESPDAMALTDAYSDIFEKFSEELGDNTFNLQSLSCGHSICLGSVYADSSSDAWSGFKEYINSTGETFNAFMTVSHMTGEELVEYRFFYSTASNIMGISIE